MDELDLRILGELERDSSRPLRAIAKVLGIPTSTLHSRIKKLRSAEILKGFRAVLDPRSLGLETLAIILVSVGKDDQRAIARRIASLKGVQEVHIVTGEYDIIVKARTRNMSHLSNLVLDRIRNIPGVEKTLTSVVFETIKEDPSIIVHLND
ncbi:MAG: Lrp/AsnC family transcriptional regulator [Thermoplasmata archaeon]|nr:Lrp/AsnC family transcriptional regulator [Thermoplasmata archaeon]